MIYWNQQVSISMLQAALDKDEVLLVSGDTVLGLCARLTQKSFDKINEIKQRSRKPYLILVSSADKLNYFIDQELSEKLKTLIKTCWPGPVTLVFKAKPSLESWMISEEGTIAIRVPDHVGLLKLLSDYDGLFSTSANISSKPIPASIKSVDPEILRNIGAVCIDQGDDTEPQSPSTILDCSTGEIQVLRPGVFSVETLQSIIG
ncbi:MAG: L-threonylcarbamoyladenylate synthase [Candidatus Dependentiae bacterium]|nr:L-threonylcarbamoyladenylate synthase [Candidatus Dependentiae bacterium]